jgi:hypothetical protein
MILRPKALKAGRQNVVRKLAETQQREGQLMLELAVQADQPQ